MPHFIFIQQISVLNILNMLYNLLFFFSSKCRLFHNATLFGFCITHILNTVCAKIWKQKIRRQKVKTYGKAIKCVIQSLCTNFLFFETSFYSGTRSGRKTKQRLKLLIVDVPSTSVAGLLAKGQYPEGPATGHLDTGFAWFPCVCL